MGSVEDKEKTVEPKVADAYSAGAGYASCEQVCPLCGGPVYRIRRQFEDRLVSIFTKVHRYACRSMRCGWEGRLRVK
jgi:hypothetical protein